MKREPSRPLPETVESRRHDLAEIETALRTRLVQEDVQQAPANLRAAAVLIPILVYEGECQFLLTKRSSKLRRQPGDIAFPGGAIDASDAGPLHAALRESAEEVGLDRNQTRIVGRLRERATVTGFWLTPYVGLIASPFEFRPNEEVAELLFVPLSALGDDALSVEQRRLPSGQTRSVYHYQFGEHDIWGITGRLVKEILEILA